MLALLDVWQSGVPAGLQVTAAVAAVLTMLQQQLHCLELACPCRIVQRCIATSTWQHVCMLKAAVMISSGRIVMAEFVPASSRGSIAAASNSCRACHC
jgi:hypothetical protein